MEKHFTLCSFGSVDDLAKFHGLSLQFSCSSFYDDLTTAKLKLSVKPGKFDLRPRKQAWNPKIC